MKTLIASLFLLLLAQSAFASTWQQKAFTLDYRIELPEKTFKGKLLYAHHPAGYDLELRQGPVKIRWYQRQQLTVAVGKKAFRDAGKATFQPTRFWQSLQELHPLVAALQLNEKAWKEMQITPEKQDRQLRLLQGGKTFGNLQDRRWVWIDPRPVKDEMLNFFIHLYRPRIYIIDTDFMDGGLLLYHRDDGRALRKNWIHPTLKNINLIWKGPVSLLTKDALYSLSAGIYKEGKAIAPKFELVIDRMAKNKKPFRVA